MAKINRFEDIEAWQKGLILCNEIYEVSKEGEFAKDFSLKNQMRRCSISIISNISEGFDRESKLQFIYFLKIAKGSCAELRAQLHVALGQKYIDTKIFNDLYSKCEEVSRMISGFINYLRIKNKEKVK